MFVWPRKNGYKISFFGHRISFFVILGRHVCLFFFSFFEGAVAGQPEIGYFHHFHVLSLSFSFRKLDLTSQTCNICNILSPLYHAYFQQIALAVFKFVTHCLIWDFFCRVSCWTPGHGQKERGSYERGAVLYLSVCPIVCLYSRLAVSFLRIGSFVFSET